MYYEVMLHSGLTSGVPYSISRWTDVPATRWAWFKSSLEQNMMVAFDSRTSVPGVWSLRPYDTLGFLFWTKDPTNLISDKEVLQDYRVIVHMTATGWSEVERGAPTLDESGRLLVATAKAFDVRWRFSPIPLLPTYEVVTRFQRLAVYAADAGLDSVYTSFLQENDRIPESRTPFERFELLNVLADEASAFGLKVVHCNDDRSFLDFQGSRFQTGICADPLDFAPENGVAAESCGCVHMVDPFTINEACKFDCSYCYAGDKTLAPAKRNTTRLPVLRGGLA